MNQPAHEALEGTQSAVKTLTPSSLELDYKPIVSPEHGVYIMLLVSFMIGAAAARAWTWTTTLALICAFFAFQAEHPMVLQIRQRRSWKPRFLVWGGLYASLSLSIAIWFYLQSPILLWLYLGAAIALIIDAVSVWEREQKSVFNELITFAGICLSVPFAYVATIGDISGEVMALWCLNSLYFSSSIFIVKLRKMRTASVISGVLYHGVSSLILATLYYFGHLSAIAALAFTIALLKFSLIAWQQTWYRSAKIQVAAAIETGTALLFLAIVALSLLPARLTLL